MKLARQITMETSRNTIKLAEQKETSHNTMETSRNTTRLAQQNRNKSQYNGNKPQHNEISTLKKVKSQWKQAETQ